MSVQIEHREEVGEIHLLWRPVLHSVLNYRPFFVHGSKTIRKIRKESKEKRLYPCSGWNKERFGAPQKS